MNNISEIYRYVVKIRAKACYNRVTARIRDAALDGIEEYPMARDKALDGIGRYTLMLEQGRFRP